MNVSMVFAHKMLQAYSMRCKALCQEIKMPQTAFDILMFLANNPDYNTARDIVEVRRIKANLVSVNVDKLVQEKYLERRSVPGDRRKTLLVCTEKARPVIEKGHQVQDTFFEDLFCNIDEPAKAGFLKAVEIIGINLDNIMKGRV